MPEMDGTSVVADDAHPHRRLAERLPVPEGLRGDGVAHPDADQHDQIDRDLQSIVRGLQDRAQHGQEEERRCQADQRVQDRDDRARAHPGDPQVDGDGFPYHQLVHARPPDSSGLAARRRCAAVLRGGVSDRAAGSTRHSSVRGVLPPALTIVP